MKAKQDTNEHVQSKRLFKMDLEPIFPISDRDLGMLVIWYQGRLKLRG